MVIMNSNSINGNYNVETDDFEKNTYLTSVQKRVENGEDICRAYFR